MEEENINTFPHSGTSRSILNRSDNLIGSLHGVTMTSTLAIIAAISGTLLRSAVAALNHNNLSIAIDNRDLLYDSIDKQLSIYDENSSLETLPLNLATTTAATAITFTTNYSNTVSNLAADTTTSVFIGNEFNNTSTNVNDQNNYWALFALVLVMGTAAGNILVCLAIAWERRLQNVTNYFLMSLAITDLMVAILVMPLGILTLVKGKFIDLNLQKLK